MIDITSNALAISVATIVDHYVNNAWVLSTLLNSWITLLEPVLSLDKQKT